MTGRVSRGLFTLAWLCAYPLFALNVALEAYTGRAVDGLYSIGMALACAAGLGAMWRWRLGALDAAFAAFMAWVALRTGAGYALGQHAAHELGTYALMMGWYAGAYALGRSLDLPAGRGRLVAALLLPVAALLPLVDWSFFYLAARYQEHGQSYSVYQGVARSVAMVAILALCAARRPAADGLIVAVTVAALFVIGARSEFYSFTGAAAMALVLPNLGRRRVWLAGGAVLAVAAAALALHVVAGGSLAIDPDTSRVYELLSGQSTSLAARLALFRPILGPWLDGDLSFLFGDLLSYQRITGSTGLYIHNALSVLTDFGLPGFGLYAGLCAAAAAVLLRAHDGEAPFGLRILAGFSLLMVLAAKSLFWSEVALFWGVAAQVAAARAQRAPDPAGPSALAPPALPGAARAS